MAVLKGLFLCIHQSTKSWTLQWHFSIFDATLAVS